MIYFAKRCQTLVLAAVLLLPALHPARAQDEEKYRQIEAKELAASPQKYWATGIVFKDRLAEAPAGQTTKIGGNIYHRMRTKVLGECYLDHAVTETAEELSPHTEYIFTGTVLQRGGGFLGRSKEYVVVVRQVTPTVRDAQAIAAQIAAAMARASNEVDRVALENIASLLTDLESELTAFAEGKGLQIWQLFEPGSEGRKKADGATRVAIQRKADDLRTIPADLFAQFVMAILASRHARPELAPATGEDEEPAVEPAEESPSTPAETIMQDVSEPPAETVGEPDAAVDEQPAVDTEAEQIETAPEEPATAPTEVIEPIEPTAPEEVIDQPESTAELAEPEPENAEEPVSSEEEPAPAAAPAEEPPAPVVDAPTEPLPEPESGAEAAAEPAPAEEPANDAYAPVPLRAGTLRTR